MPTWDIERIQKNLQAIASHLPAGAKSFALSNWHYDPTHHQCPHDAWLDSLVVEELASGERQQIRKIRIILTLLGAYHDGRIQLSYEDVVRYSFEKPPSGNAHGDWLIDEVQLSPEGLAVHDIQFEKGRLRIECRDFTYSWTPFN